MIQPRSGSPDQMEALNNLLDKDAPIHTRSARTSVSSIVVKPPEELYPDLLSVAVHHNIFDIIIENLRGWRWGAVVYGVRCLLRCADEAAVRTSLQVIGTRIGEGGLQLWREEGRDAGSFIKELAEVPQSHRLHSLCMQASRSIGAGLTEVAIAGSRSEKFVDRIAALPALSAVVSSCATAIPGRLPCAFLDEFGVIADLFGERAHERIITEAESLLKAIKMDTERLGIILGAALDSHDQALRSAANKVLSGLCEELDEELLLFMLERVGGALGDEAHSDAAFDLFLMLTAAMKASDKPLLMEMGFATAEAALQLCCQAAASRLAWRRPGAFESSMEVLHVLLRASGLWEQQQKFRSFVLEHCVKQLELLQKGEAVDPGMDDGGEYARSRALYAILRSVVEIHPISATTFHRRSRSVCIDELEANHGIMDQILSEITVMACRSRLAGWSLLEAELWGRLEAMRFLLEQSSVKLSSKQVLTLWEALEEAMPDALIRWMRLALDSGGCLDHQAIHHVFGLLSTRGSERGMLQTMHGLDCFCAFFTDANAANGRLSAAGRRGGGGLTGPALVGRRIAIRKLHGDKSMLLGTVEKHQKGQVFTLSWEDGTEEEMKDLETDGEPQDLDPRP